jgi:hypothetical protein
MKKGSKSFGANLKHAKAIWGRIPKTTVEGLRELTKRLALSVANGDLQLLDGRWYVTHSGLLRVAQRRRCRGIVADVQENLSNPSSNSWVFKATVYKDGETTTGFVGYGDANPGNVSTPVLGAEMRIAETRAVNRALRKAYGIGLCSVEELNSPSSQIELSRKMTNPAPLNGNGSTNRHPRLRDRLCLLIRKYELDPAQVKRYAADFCGTESLRDAGRDLVESFITTLAEQAAKDRDGLICKLNSYGDTQAVNP